MFFTIVRDTILHFHVITYCTYKSKLTAKAFKVVGLNISDRSNKFGRPFMEVTQ